MPQRLRSTPGEHDGFVLAVAAGDEQSPLGPLIAAARVEGYRQHARIMTTNRRLTMATIQDSDEAGQACAGGKYDYITNGHMIGGFALVAWPAEWGNSGVMTFIVNQQGKILEENLGPRTAVRTKAMTRYDPDGGWNLVKGQ